MSSNKRVTFQIDAQDNASAKLKALESQTSKLKSTTDSHTSTLKKNSAASLSLGSIYNALAVGAVASFTKTIIANASSMEQNRIAFETMLGSAEQASLLLSKLSEFARKTPFDLPQLVEGTKKLLAYGTAAGEIIPTMNALGNIAAGVGADKMPQLILAFGQVRTATKLTGMELRQFTEAGVPLLDMLAKQSGKSAAQIKKDMEGGAAPSFAEVKKAIFAMSEDGGKFFNLMEKQSQTLGGQLSNLKDNFFRLGNAVVGVSDTGDVIEGSFFDTVRKGVFGLNDSLDGNYRTIVTWGSAIINSFSALGRTLYNAVSIIARILTAPIVMAVSGVRDAIETIKSWLQGDFSVSVENIKAGIEVLGEGISGDLNDIGSAWTSASKSVDIASSSSSESMGELSNASNDLANDISEDSKKISDKMDSFAKKIKDVKDKLKDLKNEYKDSQKELKEDYKESLKQQKTVLGENIAGVLYSKEEELAKLKQDLMAEESGERKTELGTQIKTIEDFLANHKEDYQAYAKDLKALRKYNAMDEIEQLKFDYNEKKKELAKQYEEDLEDLKKQYKKRKKELEKHLDEIKDELKKFLKSTVVKDASKLMGIDINIPGRATGGPVSSGSPYVVGERGPELFVPNGSGTIIPNSAMGGTTFNFTFNGDISDKDQLISTIKQAIGRELELSRYGIG
jgi:tape measure domain-containing protein